MDENYAGDTMQIFYYLHVEFYMDTILSSIYQGRELSMQDVQGQYTPQSLLPCYLESFLFLLSTIYKDCSI